MFFDSAKKGSNGLGWYFLTILLIFVGYALGQFSLMLVFDENELLQFMDNPDFGAFGVDKNLGLILLLTMFIFAMIALWFGVRFLHKKRLKDLITSKENIDFAKIFWAFGMWFALGIIFEIGLYFLEPANYAFSFNIKTFIPLLLIALFILPIQTSFEEFFFRGYLMQGIGYLTRNRMVPIIITSILFGLVHGTNPEVAEYGLGIMMTYYIGAGLVLAIMTIMDDSLELALGVHAATNIYGALFLSYEGAAIQTDTIVRTTNMNALHLLIVFLCMSTLFLFVCGRKYNWKPYSYLFTKIEFNEV